MSGFAQCPAGAVALTHRSAASERVPATPAGRGLHVGSNPHLLFPNPRHVFELPPWPAPCASPQNRTGLCEEVSVRIVLFSSRASLQLLPEDWPRYPAAGLYSGMTLFKEQAP